MSQEGQWKSRVMGLLEAGKYSDARLLLADQGNAGEPDIDALYLLGVTHGLLGSFPDAEICCRKVIDIRPDFPEALYNLGNALKAQGRKEEAIRSYNKAIRLKPDYADAYINMGNAFRELNQLTKAESMFNQALEIMPQHALVHYNLGNVFKAQGRITLALDSYRKAMEIHPDFRWANGNLVSCMNYDPTADSRTLYNEHLGWANRFGAQQRIVAYANVPYPERKLRVGYVSPDLRRHSVACFLEPLLVERRQEAFEVTCYAEVEHPDAVTRRLQDLSDRWRSTCGLTDEEMVDMVSRDDIDILVDLAGHTAGNRLGVFARKPAPVQVTYLGYPNTTGLAMMDYRLTDALADPPGMTDDVYTEKLVRLPSGFLCYQPPAEAPAVAPLPSTKNDYITFGSFNNMAKVNEGVISVWAGILNAVAGARLLIKNESLADAPTADRYRNSFIKHGIDASHVEFIGPAPDVTSHLDTYSRVDIALDTFPYNGTTTTCEALWMGVPVITLAGQQHAGRVGASILSHVGLTDLITEDAGKYIQAAVELATNTENLKNLRATLRNSMTCSSLCNNRGFVNEVETVYRNIWRAWCRK